MNGWIYFFRKILLVSALLNFSFGSVVWANTAAIPTKKEGAGWLGFHERFLVEAKAGGIDVLFLGDSITQYWGDPGRGLPVWQREFGALRAANFGINGDRIQHVLWRLQNGEAEGFSPKLVVLLLGTNNTTPRNTTAEVLAGLEAVVAELRKGFPEAKILLLGILPRGVRDDPKRGQIAEINHVLARWAEPGRLRFLDVGKAFLDEEGQIPVEVMPDGLHPNLKGYDILARAIRGPIREMLAEP